MSNNNSDYKKPFTDLYELLPGVNKTSTNKSLFSNLYNRFLSKPELIHKDGYVGQSSTNFKRNLIEPSPDRQAYQLQPMLYNKIGTVEYMKTYQDVLKELERLGVDITKNKSWNDSQKFNWVPPIDIDKLINYNDYFWFDDTNPTSQPQYITIKNLCNQAESKVASYQQTLDNYGNTFQITNIDTNNNTITINDDYSVLLVNDFNIYIKNSGNQELNEKFWTVDKSEFDAANNKTIIYLKQNFNDNTTSGIISLTEFMTSLTTNRDCICNGSMGWDNILWDDNNLTSLKWNTSLLTAISHPTLSDWINTPNDPTTGYNIWYNTTTDNLKQWNGTLPYTDENNWKIIENAFSVILTQTEGTNFWDESKGCSVNNNQWIEQNKWFHKSVITNFTNAKQAKIPIIEYNPNLELNSWVEKTYNWYYRPSNLVDFKETDKKPNYFDIVELKTYDVDNRKSFVLNGKYGDLTNIFKPGYRFNISNSIGSQYGIVAINIGNNSSIDVTGDATQDYTSINDTINPNNLPSKFNIHNSVGGALDGSWTIDNIVYNSFTNITTISLISSETFSSPNITNAEIYATNSGVYTVDYSLFENIKSEYNILSINTLTNSIEVSGNVTIDSNIDKAFYIVDSSNNNGVWTSLNMNYDQLNDKTIIILDETLNPVGTNTGKISISYYRTKITVIENLPVGYGSNDGGYSQGISDGSRFVPLKTSLGDNWNGYNEQWCFRSFGSVLPINNQVLNPYLEIDLTKIQNVSTTYGHNLYSTGDFEYSVNNNAQYINVKKTSGISNFELHPLLQKLNKKGTNNIRVYVRKPGSTLNERQYGNYEEYTEKDLLGSGDDTYIIGIKFSLLSPIQQFSDVIIDAGVSSIDDIGYEAITVRNEPNDSVYNASPSTNVITTSFAKYRVVEQLKTTLNQYPLFNLYDVSGKPSHKVSKIFGFKEDSTAPIDPNVNKRIVIENGDYQFEQELITEDNGAMFTYRDYDVSIENNYYNTFDKLAYNFTNNTWTTRILTDNYYLHTIISEITPTKPNELIIGQLWYNPNENKLYEYNGSNFVPKVVGIKNVDPTLKSIWIPGNNKEKYDPKYVDGQRNPEAIGSDLGAWEIPDPLYYNVHHENKKVLKFSELLTHFKTILQAQSQIPGFTGTPEQQFFLMSNPNYGLGGTIREYNDGFDSLLSTIFINNLTPLQLFDFAHTQYLKATKSISESFVNNAEKYLTDTSQAAVDDLNKFINDSIISEYELNDFNELLYSDSPTYNKNTNKGIKNWIATAPFFGLSEKYLPYIIKDNKLGIHKVKAHDGHYIDINLETSVKLKIINTLLNKVDNRVDVGPKFGNNVNQYNTSRPNTGADFKNAYQALNISSGKYWYSTINNEQKLYKFNIVAASNVQPNNTYVDGSYWYDTGTLTLKIKSGNNWLVVTNIGDDDITAAWQEIQIEDFLASLILEVESRLYQALPTTIDMRYDFNDLRTNYPTEFFVNEKINFNSYTKDNNIELPLSLQLSYNLQDAFTWNYKNSNIINQPYSGSPTGTNIAGSWEDMYEKIYGTAYPNLEPWKLQGYKDKPSYWDSLYKDTSGLRKWNYNHATTTGMWENIRLGIVPIGKELPNGDISTGVANQVRSYSFLSVMVDDNIVDGYKPDSLLPPYWDHKPILGATYSGIIKTIFDNYSQITQPNLDFKFNDVGNVEFNWRHSSDYIYSLMETAFKIQPQRFIHKAIGIDYVILNDLQLNKDTNKVFSHKDIKFHGQLLDDLSVYESLGLNQWYINYNRYSGFDSNSSDFQRMWVNWNTPLTYQFASFIDSRNFLVQNPNYEMVEQDFDLSIKKTYGIRDSWIDSLKITLLKMPAILSAYDSESDWKFNIDIPNNIGRDIKYYEVQKYPILINESTNELEFYKFKLVSVNVLDNTFAIFGDWYNLFTKEFDVIDNGNQITLSISNSPFNDGNYTVSSVRYDEVLNLTVVKVIETIQDGSNIGLLKTNYRYHNWATGDEVRLTSDKTMPVGFNEEKIYYVIKIGSDIVKLANTRLEALNNNEIPFNNIGTGQLFVGKIDRTFQAISGRTNRNFWKKYTLDKTVLKKFNTSRNITGIQHLIDFVYGYEEHTKEDLWKYNFDKLIVDEELGRVIDWQFEIEKFIDELFKVNRKKYESRELFIVKGNNIANTMEFIPFLPQWQTGTKVVLSSDNELPQPLIKNIPYYIVRNLTDPKTFKLSLTKDQALKGITIDFLSDGDESIITEYKEQVNNIKFELNPFKNGIWYETPQGILADIVEGPFTDIRIDQTIYDQYGRLIDVSNINVYREDKISKIVMDADIPNDVEIGSDKNIHFGGLHVFVNGYEHVIMFKNYSASNFLIYDPFIGLNTARFDLFFESQEEFILRPNVGGQFLKDGTQLFDNMEANIKNLEYAYDTYSTGEYDIMTKQARDSLGYEGTQTYLDHLDINSKSQFIYWKGMIQSKGTVNAMNAFINSKKFIDAKLDEFWAYKVAEFGDIKRKIYPEINLEVKDSLSNELKIDFIKKNQTPLLNFKPIEIDDEKLWYEYPNQKSDLSKMGEQFYFNSELTSVDDIDKNRMGEDGNYVYELYKPFHLVNSNWYYITNDLQDNVIITYYEKVNDVQHGWDHDNNPNTPDQIIAINDEIYTRTLVEGVDFIKINSKVIKFLVDPETFTKHTNNNKYGLKIYTVNFAKSKHNTSKIIDYKSKTVITNIPVWNPAKGHHYHIADHLIDIKKTKDIAKYSNTLNNANKIDLSVSNPLTKKDIWDSTQKGLIWLDTSTLGYKPYYDDKIIPSITDRIKSWGVMADWATISLYEWTESDISPYEWNKKAEKEEVDKSIDNSIRKTGRVKELLYYFDGTNYIPSEVRNEVFYVVINNSNVYTLEYIEPHISLTDQQSVNAGKANINIKVYLNESYLGEIPATDLNRANKTVDITNLLTSTNTVLKSSDIIRFIQPSYMKYDDKTLVFPSQEELDSGKYKIEVPYTEIITKDNEGKNVSTYYFWTTNKSNIYENSLSMKAMVEQLKNIPIPYMIAQGLLPEEIKTFPEITLPYRYTKLIIRGLAGIVNDNDRYKLRLDHDFTLRDDIDDGKSPLDLKNTHDEWKLFREKQPYHIDRVLWDKIVESIIGKTLLNGKRVPSLDKELYDDLYGKNTKYGIQPGQIFLDGNLAKQIILDDLFDPNNEFYPVDIDQFVATHNFDNDTNTLKFLDDIFNRFGSEHVNRIFFKMLETSLTFRSEYPDIFKTSYVALHGIRVLDDRLD